MAAPIVSEMLGKGFRRHSRLNQRTTITATAWANLILTVALHLAVLAALQVRDRHPALASLAVQDNVPDRECLERRTACRAETVLHRAWALALDRR